MRKQVSQDGHILMQGTILNVKLSNKWIKDLEMGGLA